MRKFLGVKIKKNVDKGFKQEVGLKFRHYVDADSNDSKLKKDTDSKKDNDPKKNLGADDKKRLGDNLKKSSGRNLKINFGMDKTRNRLILAFFVPVLSIIMLGIISYEIAAQGLNKSYEASAQSAAQGKSDLISYNMESMIQKADVLVSNEIIMKYFSGFYKSNPKEQKSRWSEIVSLVSKEIIAQEAISNIFIVTQDGEHFSGNGTKFGDFDYNKFLQAEGAILTETKEGKAWIGEHPYLDQMTGGKKSDYAISYICNINNFINEPMGSLVINVSMKSIHKIIDNTNMPAGSFIGMITKDGREIFTDNVDQDFNLSGQPFFQELMKSQKVTESQYIELEGKQYLFTYKEIGESGISICSFVPKSEILSKANELKLVTLAMILFAGVTAIVLGAFIANGYSKTLKGVNQVLQQVEKGDLTSMTKVARRDEFSILGRCINDVIKGMSGLIKQMKSSSSTVSKSAFMLSDNSMVLVSATENIVRAIQDIETGVVQQAEDAETGLIQMNDLVEQIQELYERTNNIEQIAGNTSELVRDGMSSMDHLCVKANDTKEVTKNVIGDIEKLEVEISAISGILETMKQIADQTNLLSLNASIEASRAGEFGRGFSVVAYEIRKLAEQSVNAASEIARIIGKINGQTRMTVKSAQYAESIVSSQEEALSQSMGAFQDISKHVGDLTGNLNKMVANVEGIENAKNNTLKTIESISATTEETAAASEELNVSASNQLQTVNALNDIVQQLKDDSGLLMNAVSIFHIKD